MLWEGFTSFEVIVVVLEDVRTGYDGACLKGFGVITVPYTPVIMESFERFIWEGARDFFELVAVLLGLIIFKTNLNLNFKYNLI